MKSFLRKFFVAFFLFPLSILPGSAATIFSDGFENGLDANWQFGDNDIGGTPAYWGVVNFAFGGENTHAGTNKIYCAGIGFAGTTTAPKYQNSMSAYLLRSIDLTGYTNATLSFWFKIPSIETNYDYARIYMDDTEIWIRDRAATVWTQTNLSLGGFVGGVHTLKFEFNSDTSITNEGWYLDDISVTDVYTQGPPPPNDNFSAAKVLVGAAGSVGGNNADATSEPGETNGYNTVWFRWTATTNGAVTFRTGGSSFDTVMCVYTGSVLTNLTAINCDDNGDTNNASLVSFNAVSGTTYQISVRGINLSRGFILLNWIQPNGIGQMLLPDLSVWADVANDYLYGWYLDRTEIPGRTLLRASTATPNTGTGALELRGSSTQPGVYQRIFYSGGGYTERFAGNFTFHPAHGHLHFDNWLNFRLRAVLTNDGVGDIVTTGDKTSFAIIDLEKYAALPGSPASAYYNGGLVQGLSVGWADVYGANLPDQWIDVTSVAPGRYWLEAVVDPADNILESNETNNTARVLIELGVPANNNFTNALVLSGAAAGVVSYNIDANKETGEPNHAGNVGGHSIWYQWTAPSNMTVVITTDGSEFNTVLAVYTGANVSALTAVKSDNDSGAGTASKVTFTAVAGTTYHIAVDGVSGAVGRVELNFNPSWNDTFTNAIVLSGQTGSITGSDRGATRQTGEPLHAGITNSHSIWYSWTATNTGLVTFDTILSGYDTLLGIYTGTSVSSLTLVTNDNNSAGNVGWSRVVFPASNGTTYQIAVAGGPGTNGIVKLNWSVAAPPTITSHPLGTNAPAGATVSFSVFVSGSGPFSYQWLHQGNELADNKNISGAKTATLTIDKIQPPDFGSYSVIVTNNFGSVTSAPATLIVLDNSRVVFVHGHEGHIGGVVSAHIEMQAVGDEHALNFSLAYDPAVLSNPRIAASEVGATFTVETNLAASGKFGATLTLPTDQTVGPGDQEWALVLFDANSTATNGTATPIGFTDQPISKLVSGTNGASLVTLFAAGEINLIAVEAVGTGTQLADGRYQVSLSGIAGRDYAIEVSDNLVGWTSISTNQMDLDGQLEFIDNQSTNFTKRFYRALLLP